ncbi:MAG: six-hairpin [Prolixibacteraceae bacterium]|nr:MAG: six-hairpin [Prolixibacteraceae bacterium]
MEHKHTNNLILGKAEYLAVIHKMLLRVTPQFSRYPMAYANWDTIMLKITSPYFEIAILGDGSEKVLKDFQKEFRPDVLLLFSKSESEIPIFKNRFVKDKTLIYVCKDGVCQLPVETARQAFETMN